MEQIEKKECRFCELVSENLSSYLLGCKSFIEKVFQEVINEFGLSQSAKSFKLHIDESNYKFSPQTVKVGKDRYIFVVSIGTIIAIDDFSILIAPFINHHVFTVGERVDMENYFILENRRNKYSDNYHADRFYDYSRIINDFFKGRIDIKQAFVMQHLNKYKECSNLCAKLILKTILAHELGHVLLGHCDHDRQSSSSEKWKYESGRERKNFLNTYICREIHADIYSIFYLFKKNKDISLSKTSFEGGHTLNLEQRPSITASLKMLIVSYTSIFYDKASKVNHDSSFPLISSSTRLYNTYMVIEFLQTDSLNTRQLFDRAFYAASKWLFIFIHLDYVTEYFGLYRLDSNTVYNFIKKQRSLGNTLKVNVSREWSTSTFSTSLMLFKGKSNLFTKPELEHFDIDNSYKYLESLIECRKLFLEFSPVELIGQHCMLESIEYYLNYIGAVWDSDTSSIDLFKHELAYTAYIFNGLEHAKKVYSEQVNSIDKL